MNVFDLSAKIALDTNEYKTGLESASSETNNFGTKLKGTLGTASKVAVGVITAVTSAVVALSAEMRKGIQETAEYGDNIDKMSQKMGLSAQSYQEWDFVLQHAGTSIDSMKASMKTLANAAENNNEAFTRLGITQEELATLSQEDLFARTIEALQNVEDVTERTYLAGKTLGRGATELGALLNMSAEETEEMKQQLHDLGGVMSDEAVKASAQYADSLQNLQTAIGGLKRGVFSEFLPATVDMMDGLTQIFGGNSESGIGLIAKGVDDFMEQLSEMIPKVMDIGSKILLSLVQAISDNLPKMMDGGVKAVMTFIQGIVKMLPSIIKSGVQVIVSLVKGIGESLPELIPAVVDAMLTIVQSIVENIDMIIDAALTFMLGFIDGIIQAIPVIIDALPDLINALIDGILGAIPLFIEAGITLLTSLVSAIPDIILGIVKNLPKIIDGIISGIMDNLPAMIEAGVTLFIALITNIPKIIVEIVKKLPEIIVGIVQGLIDNIGQIIEAGVELMKGLGEGIASWAGKIWEKAKEIGQKVLDGIGQFFTDMREAGKNLVVGLWNGIHDKIEWIKEKIRGWVDNVLGWFKKLFGIESPSKVMAGFGDMLDQGLVQGMERSLDDVLNAATDIRDGVNEALEGMGGSVDVDMSSPSLRQSGVSRIEETESALMNISERLDYLEDSLYNAIIKALRDGVDFRANDRVLGRFIKEYV